MTHQTCSAILSAIAWLGTVVSSAAAEKESELRHEESRVDVREAATRAVRLIERTSSEFLGTRKCFTCHTQTRSVAVLSEARKVGIEIDEQNFKQQVERVSELADSLDGLRVDTVGHGLWALDLGGHGANDMTHRMSAFLLSYQKELGHWKVTVDRPPAEASDFTTNYVAIRGLKRYGTDDQEAEIAAREAAIKRWIPTAKAANTEDLVFRLYLAHEIGAGPEQRESFASELLRQQQASGGWAQEPGMKADAYATGSALVALQKAGGISRDHPAWQRGLTYLLETQEPDGSWHVVSRAKPIQEYFESGFPYGTDQFISAFGTGWAAEALLISLRQETED